MACFSRNRIFGYDFIAYSSIAIAALSFVVWGHHMFTSGQSIYTSVVFSILSFLVAVPSAVKTFNWTATMYKGRVILDSPMLFALGFLGLFAIGGLTGLVLATLGVDIHMHDTYFVVAHFHYIMVGGAIMGFMGGIHFWWPKMTGRMYPETFGKLSALTIFIGFNLTFFPQFIMGYMGMPRRYHSYVEDYTVWHVASSCGASILIGGYVMTVAYLFWSLKYGQRASANPWGAKGLEWTTPSPPPTENFHKMPVVREEAYAYNIDEEEDVHETV
jgi:cytochrome c oxidase subunit 1